MFILTYCVTGHQMAHKYAPPPGTTRLSRTGNNQVCYFIHMSSMTHVANSSPNDDSLNCFDYIIHPVYLED